MDVLSTLGIVSQGLRLAKQVIPNHASGSGKPFQVAAQESLGEKLLNRQDTNGDGGLSIDEVKFSDTLFKRLDSDADGKLSIEELNTGASQIQEAQRMAQHVAQYIESHDADHNALISIMESGLDETQFDTLDNNKDHALNRGEITSAHRKHTLDLST